MILSLNRNSSGAQGRVIAMRAKKRRFQKGCLRQASGSWIVKYYDASGVQRTETVGRAMGPDRISRNEAERRRSELMQGINSEPKRSSMTFAQFIEKKFLPTRRDEYYDRLGRERLIIKNSGSGATFCRPSAT